MAPPPRPQLSMVGEPSQAPPRRHALPPAPMAVDALERSMHACWGGPWASSSTHGPPPATASTHPPVHRWVPDFRPQYHAAPGMDLRPARLTSCEKAWAGSSLPPVEHGWMTDVEALARAQLACFSSADWLLGLLFGASSAAPAQQAQLKRLALREISLATQFGAALVAASTLARRKAILDQAAVDVMPSTRDWLLLQPVTLTSHQGLFGPVSALVPDIQRQHHLQQASWTRGPKTSKVSFRPRGPQEPQARPSQAPQPPPTGRPKPRSSSWSDRARSRRGGRGRGRGGKQ